MAEAVGMYCCSKRITVFSSICCCPGAAICPPEATTKTPQQKAALAAIRPYAQELCRVHYVRFDFAAACLHACWTQHFP